MQSRLQASHDVGGYLPRTTDTDRRGGRGLARRVRDAATDLLARAGACICIIDDDNDPLPGDTNTVFIRSSAQYANTHYVFDRHNLPRSQNIARFRDHHCLGAAVGLLWRRHRCPDYYVRAPATV